MDVIPVLGGDTAAAVISYRDPAASRSIQPEIPRGKNLGSFRERRARPERANEPYEQVRAILSERRDRLTVEFKDIHCPSLCVRAAGVHPCCEGRYAELASAPINGSSSHCRGQRAFYPQLRIEVKTVYLHFDGCSVSVAVVERPVHYLCPRMLGLGLDAGQGCLGPIRETRVGIMEVRERIPARASSSSRIAAATTAVVTPAMVEHLHLGIVRYLGVHHHPAGIPPLKRATLFVGVHVAPAPIPDRILLHEPPHRE